ncbi:predicted protein [Uncinocarpus reesii 1704]|uniref:Uncharacterized protein n=1 Tax=Uncinocarpus reesii (strain UAMH 1704) TaxID=336963 RepID=C4JHY9_UNCRE|nr:uncharacterized protein UREG_01414 [Uncinocarpus reesii 1704]EEP76565.1 predicted protein [Uncinocarpus reesii 1704]
MSVRLRRQTNGHCPKGYSWYRCAKGPFAGCCDEDPCDTGICPNPLTVDSSSSTTPAEITSSKETSDTTSTTSSGSSPSITSQTTTTSMTARISPSPTYSLSFTTSTLNNPNPAQTSITEPLQTPQAERSGLATGSLFAIIVPIIAVIIIVLVLAVCCFKRRKKRLAGQVRGTTPVSKLNGFRSSCLAPALELLKSAKPQTNDSRSSSGGTQDIHVQSKIKELHDKGATAPDSAALSASPGFSNNSPSLGPAPPTYRSSPNPLYDEQIPIRPMELPGSFPQGPPIELDDTSCERVAELSTPAQQALIDIPLSQRTVYICPNRRETTTSSANGPLSITTHDGVVLAPNLMCSCGQRHHSGATDHVTSFMDYQSNIKPPR